MAQSSYIERLLLYWEASEDLVVNAGATPEEIDVVERRLGQQLPPLLRSIYEAADGFSLDGYQDSEGFSLWPCDLLKWAEDYDRDFRTEDGISCLLFMDYLDASWTYGLRLDQSEHREEVHMFLGPDGRPLEVANSLEDFLEKYLVDDVALYG